MPQKGKRGKRFDHNSKVEKRKKDGGALGGCVAFTSSEQQQLKAILKIDDITPAPFLIGATILNKRELIRQLFRQGGDVNATDKQFGRTPLMWAVKLKHVECIDVLLGCGANPLIKNKEENDILFLALESKLWDEITFRTLYFNIKTVARIEVNATNQTQRTMLHLAVRRGWKNCVDLLIDEKANINAQSVNGVAPLMMAGFTHNLEIVHVLIEAGADPLLEDNKQANALCYAISSIIMKNAAEPHLVVEKLIGELERNGTTFKEYLQRCFCLAIETPIKPNKNDIADMKMNVIFYIIKYVDKGIDLLFEIKLFPKIKECLEKFASDSLIIRKNLVALKYILECSHELGDERNKRVLNNFVTSGVADCCLNTLRRYEHDATCDWNCLIFSSLVNLVDSDKTKIWLQRNYECIKFLEESSTVNLPPNLKEKSAAIKVLLQNAAAFNGDFSKSKMALDAKSSVKKTKRRTRALKAKINKIKSADLTERLHQNGNKKQLRTKSISDTNIASIPKSPTPHSGWESSNTSSSLDDSTRIVNDLKKTAYDFLAANGEYTEIESDDSGFPDLKNASKGKRHTTDVPLSAEQTIQGMRFNDQEIDGIIEYAIQSLSSLLKQIICQYRSIWEQEAVHQAPEDLIKMQQLENESIDHVQAKFDQLILHIKSSAYRNFTESVYILDKLEHLLLGHKVRERPLFGERYFNHDYQCSSMKQLYDLLDQKEHKPVYRDHHPDLLYLREVLALPPKTPTTTTQLEANKRTTMENAYHLIPSILAICDEDDRLPHLDHVTHAFNLETDAANSKWSSIVLSLQDMKNTQLFLNGDLRMSSKEKRDSHMIAHGGNFGIVELGLDATSRPVAVKRIPKDGYISKVVKSLLNPLIGVRNTNLLHYFLCHYEGDELFLATPLCEYNIGEYIMLMKHTSMVQLTPLEIVKQFLAGLRFLHDRDEPIVHGNLKPSNVFIDSQGVVKVAEFGMHPVLFTLAKASSTSIIWFSRETLTLFKETERMQCSCASDIQVAGMMLHFILTAGSHPYGRSVDEILKNLEKSLPQLSIVDLDLHDVISWMLLYEPVERPTVNQVLSHVFFWSIDKKWRFILACAGVGPHGSLLCVPLKGLHSYIDAMTAKEDIHGSWLGMTRQAFGNLVMLQDEDDSVSGLLRFIRTFMQSQGSVCTNIGCKVRNFILATFPALPLSLYRILESSVWMQHRVLQPFASVDSLSA